MPGAAVTRSVIIQCLLLLRRPHVVLQVRIPGRQDVAWRATRLGRSSLLAPEDSDAVAEPRSRPPGRPFVTV